MAKIAHFIHRPACSSQPRPIPTESASESTVGRIDEGQQRCGGFHIGALRCAAACVASFHPRRWRISAPKVDQLTNCSRRILLAAAEKNSDCEAMGCLNAGAPQEEQVDPPPPMQPQHTPNTRAPSQRNLHCSFCSIAQPMGASNKSKPCSELARTR